MRPTAPRELPPTPEGWIFQLKYNGWNVIINKGRIYTRRGNDITEWLDDWGFPLDWDVPLNGELTAHLGGLKDVASIKTKKFEPRIDVFDVMVEGMLLEERLELMKKLVGDTYFGLVPAVTFRWKSWERANMELAYFKGTGHEGLVLKREGSPYVIGSEISVISPDWLKFKVPAQV